MLLRLRGVAEIPRTPEELLKCTEDYETRKQWDELFIAGKCVRQLDETHQIIHFKFKVLLFLFIAMFVLNISFQSPSMMVTNRDFILSRAVRRKDDGVILSNHVSVNVDECPDEKGFVRAEALASGYWIKPTETGSTIAYLVQIDPKGVSF